MAGSTVRAGAMFYKVVVQAFMLYRSEIWFIVDSMMKDP